MSKSSDFKFMKTTGKVEQVGYEAPRYVESICALDV